MPLLDRGAYNHVLEEKSLPSSIDDKNLSEQQLMLLKKVIVTGEIPLQEFVGQIDDLRELLSRGLLRLRISMHVWGVEYIVTTGSKTARNIEEKDAKINPETDGYIEKR